MKCAIMQPTYLSWAGYFNLISQIDYFVFLDDAQFEKSSWHNRNRILVNKKAFWLTVPVIRKFLGQPLCGSLIDDTKNWRRQHCNTIIQNYSKHEYFEILNPILNIIQDHSIKILSLLNIKIIKEICHILFLRPQFIYSSQMNIQGKRTQRLINICELLQCDHYISPFGAKAYLEEDGFLSSNIKLSTNHVSSLPYPQRNSTNFESYLSIIDVLANLGPKKTQEYILNINQEVNYVS